jgi:hypothetical protein
MRKRIATIGLAMLLAMLAVIADGGRATAADDPLDRRNGVELNDTPVEEALTSIGAMAGLPVELNGFTGDPVSMEIWNVRLRTMLDVLCESLGCRWELVDGTIQIHEVPGARPEPRPKASLESLDQKMDIKLTGASALEVLRSFGEILSVTPYVDPAITGSVTVNLENTEVRKVLDAVCASVGCEWSLDVERKILAFRPKPK